MSFWKSLFGTKPAPASVPPDPGTTFEAALREAVPRYTSLERDGLNSTGKFRVSTELLVYRCHAWVAWAVGVISLAACAQTPSGGGLVCDLTIARSTTCSDQAAPAHVTPVYVRPDSDSVALDALLDGAGYAGDGNSDWLDLAAGNFCGGPEPELVLLKSTHSKFSILRGPVPYAVGTGDLDVNDAHPWRAVTAGLRDGTGYDAIVAVRKVTADDVPDLVVAKADPASCFVTTIVASATIGTPANSDWLDAAVGNFDGTGNTIALLRAGHAQFTLVKLSARNTLDVVYQSDLDNDARFPWKAIAAADLDGDGRDELVVARSVNDGASATVLAYQWNGAGFSMLATADFGKSGNSDFVSMAAGDFNADGRRSVALVKNQHSNFAILDLPPQTSTLRVVATSDLDSVAGQSWRGAVATDWLDGDLGAAELIAVRAAHAPYRTDLFVYGNRFHRIARDSGLEDTKAQWDQLRNRPVDVTIGNLIGTHTSTMNWELHNHPPEHPSGDYKELVEFLDATRDLCIDGRRLRVWITLVPPASVTAGYCSLPENSPLTAWNELDYFAAGHDGDPVALCTDYLAWASLIGRLAQDYPQVVALGIDDFGNHPELYPGDVVAEMQSRMRSQAPWLNFVPTGYYHNFAGGRSPDLSRTFDTVLFFFRNERAGQCLSEPCGEDSLPNVPGEVDFMTSILPAGRRLQLGGYFVTLYSQTPPQTPSIRYGYNIARIGLSLPSLAGMTAYGMQPDPDPPCDETNYLDSKYCALAKAFSSPRPPLVCTTQGE